MTRLTVSNNRATKGPTMQKTVTAKIRLTAPEMGAFQATAAALGLSLSSWARMVLKKAANTSKPGK